MSEPEGDELARFESFARKLVNTPKPKPSADPPSSTGEPAEDGAEREEAEGDEN